MSFVHFTADIRNSFIDQFAGDLDNGTIEIRSGTPPATAADTATGSLLVELDFGYPALGVPSEGLATSTSLSPGTATGAGTATWARFKTSGGFTVFDADVSDTSGSGAVKLATTGITIGMEVSITGFSIGFAAS